MPKSGSAPNSSTSSSGDAGNGGHGGGSPDRCARGSLGGPLVRRPPGPDHGRRIGDRRCLAAAFALAGARVLATAVNDAEIAEAPRHPRTELRRLDVRDDAGVRRLVSGFDGLDVVVNCAGVIRRRDEHEPAVFAEVVDVNLVGTMRVCAAARPLLARSGGVIVNLASMLSFFGGGLVPGYAASKGGIVQLTKSLAIYAAEGIRVNAIAPGWVRTNLTRDLQADPQRDAAILARTPLGRWGEPSDLAGAVLFLASPLAGFITGAVLAVDGGYAAA